jgi:large subunit ribosomal protein L33
MRELITLACQDCKRRNYNSTKNKKLHKEKVELKKYCPTCRKHVLHKEIK